MIELFRRLLVDAQREGITIISMVVDAKTIETLSGTDAAVGFVVRTPDGDLTLKREVVL